jgi:flavin reductase (DIM6/NTAB) family NADH-FMN oxidoreductase RutF
MARSDDGDLMTENTLDSSVSADEFRHAMGHFATGVTVVTTVGAAGEPVGTTASAVTSLSLDPPLLLVCFDLDSLTLRAIRARDAFVVNVLADRHQHLSVNFARSGESAAWEGVQHRPGPTGMPRIDDSLAVLDCTVEHYLPGGDHEIVVGRVRHATVAADAAGGADGAAPLVFYRGTYTSLGQR